MHMHMMPHGKMVLNQGTACLATIEAESELICYVNVLIRQWPPGGPLLEATNLLSSSLACAS